MNWTTKPPTVEGYYWMRTKFRGQYEDAGIVEIWTFMDKLHVNYCGADDLNPLSREDAIWYGPLSVPDPRPDV